MVRIKCVLLVTFWKLQAIASPVLNRGITFYTSQKPTVFIMILVHWKGTITVLQLLITFQSSIFQCGEYRFQRLQESPTSAYRCMFPQFPQGPFGTTVSFGDHYIKPLLFSRPICLQNIRDFSVPVPCTRSCMASQTSSDVWNAASDTYLTPPECPDQVLITCGELKTRHTGPQ